MQWITDNIFSFFSLIGSIGAIVFVWLKGQIIEEQTIKSIQKEMEALIDWNRSIDKELKVLQEDRSKTSESLVKLETQYTGTERTLQELKGQVGKLNDNINDLKTILIKQSQK